MTEPKERSRKATKVLLSVDEVAEMLRSSRRTVYRFAAGRLLPFYKLPGGIRFKLDDIESYLDACRLEPNDAPTYGHPPHRG